MKIKRVMFLPEVKKWDGLCYKSKFLENFILTFSEYKKIHINKLSVRRHIKKYASVSTYKDHLEMIFIHISELINKIKKSDKNVKISFLSHGGGRIKYVTSENLNFLNHIENILIDLIFT